MFKLTTRTVFLVVATQVFPLCTASQSKSKNLTKVLSRGFTFAAPPGSEFGLQPGELTNLADFSSAARAVAPAFADAISQAVTLNFPLASVAPAFSYRFNPAVDIFERVTNVPGPLFVERALTLGKGQFNFSLGYAFIDYSSANGTDLDNLKSPGLIFEAIDEPEMLRGQLPTGERLFSIPLSLSRIRTRID